MGQNSLNGRWHSEDGLSPVPLLRPCLCLTEPLSLGTCHSPHPQGRPLGIASHTYLGWLSAALCPVPFVTPFLYLCLLPRDPRGVRVDCCPLPPYPRSSCYAPEQEVWPNCPGSTSEWGAMQDLWPQGWKPALGLSGAPGHLSGWVCPCRPSSSSPSPPPYWGLLSGNQLQGLLPVTAVLNSSLVLAGQGHPHPWGLGMGEWPHR